MFQTNNITDLFEQFFRRVFHGTIFRKILDIILIRHDIQKKSRYHRRLALFGQYPIARKYYEVRVRIDKFRMILHKAQGIVMFAINEEIIPIWRESRR